MLITISQTTPTPPIQTDGEIELRCWYTQNFTAGDGVTPIESGDGQSSFYYIAECTLNGAGEVVIPSFIVQATTESNPTANFFGQLYVNGAPDKMIFGGASGWAIPTIYGSTVTYALLALYNRARRMVNAPNTYFTADETIREILLLAGAQNYAGVGILGRTQLDTAPAVANTPIAVGVNSPLVVTPLGITNVKTYGAVGDGVVLTDGAITVGTKILTSPSGGFASAVAGMKVDVNGAGTPNAGTQYYPVGGVPLLNANLVSIIASVQSPTQVTLTHNALTTVSGKQVVYGTDDHAAIVAAIASGGPNIYFPHGNYINGSGIKVTLINRTLRGDGMGSSIIWSVGPVAYDNATTYHCLSLNNGSHDVLIIDLGFSGTNANGELTSFGTDVADGIFMCTGIPGGYAGFCNSNLGLSNITIERVSANYFWGIGIHAPGSVGSPTSQWVANISITNCVSRYNSYDGVNMNISDGLIIEGCYLQHNGTAGFEGSDFGSIVFANNIVTFNRSGGAAFGGFAPLVNNGSVITGNTFSDNGVGIGYAAVGLIIADSQNFVISGNSFLRNSQGGIIVSGGGNGRTGLIANNIVSNNGFTGNNGIGILVVMHDVMVTGNYVTNDGIAGYQQRAGIEPAFSDGPRIVGNRVQGHTGLADYVFNTSTNILFDDPDGLATLNGMSGSTFVFPAPGPETTLAISSNTIAPTGEFHSVGAGLVKNITLPLGITRNAVISVRPTAAFTYDATGNIAGTGTATIGRTMIFTYSNVTGKWYASY